MKTAASELINDLVTRTEVVMAEANELLKVDIELLNSREAEGKWSVLECLEHLNRYGEYYLPEIENRLVSADTISSEQYLFKSSWLGEYFAESMLPKEKLNTMNTFKSMNPLGSALDLSTIHKFIEQQNTMLRHLHNARKVNMNKVKTSISISKLIRLRLGDTFRVVIYHNQRHMVQAKKALKHAQSMIAA